MDMYNLIAYLVNNCGTISWLALNDLFAEAEGITGCNISRPIWCGHTATLLQWTTLWWEMYGLRNTKILREKAVIYVSCGQ